MASTHFSQLKSKFNRGTVFPVAPEDGELFFCTTTNVLNRYNATNSAWYGIKFGIYATTTSTSTSTSTTTTSTSTSITTTSTSTTTTSTSTSTTTSTSTSTTSSTSTTL